MTTASSFANAQLTSAPLDFQAQYEQVELYLSRQHQALALRWLVDCLAARFAGETAPWDVA